MCVFYIKNEYKIMVRSLFSLHHLSCKYICTFTWEAHRLAHHCQRPPYQHLRATEIQS